MHPGMMNWWRSHHARRWHFGASSCCEPEDGYHAAPHGFGGAFGVRRPLRFLAWKLELEEPQVADLGAILDELKTERAQAAIDDRRATSALADALAAEALDEARISGLTTDRVKAAEREQNAVNRALVKIHKALDPEQRRRFAHLVRTGAIGI
jgi:Spy/CpxP family protein refolding chaperone